MMMKDLCKTREIFERKSLTYTQENETLRSSNERRNKYNLVDIIENVAVQREN